MKTISKLFLLLSIILLSSCDETELDQTVTNQVNPQKEEDSRIVFNSAKEFYNTLDTLSYMTYEEQTEWLLPYLNSNCDNCSFICFSENKINRISADKSFCGTRWGQRTLMVLSFYFHFNFLS